MEGNVMKTKRTSVVVEAEAKAVEGEEVDDDDEQLRIARLVCDALDHEVESRSAAIVAISNGHLASASVQLSWMMSKLPEHIRKMPIKKFLKQHCPNTKLNPRSDGTLRFDFVQDPVFHPPDGGTLGVSTGFSSATLVSHQYSNAVRNESSESLDQSSLANIRHELEGHYGHTKSQLHVRENLPCNGSNATVTNCCAARIS